jgi:hypothetical protein
MSEGLVLICMAVSWIAGFSTAGCVLGQGPFWDGFRSVFNAPINLFKGPLT